MRDLTALILSATSKKDYQPMRAKSLSRSLGVEEFDGREFRSALKKLIREGKIQVDQDDFIRPVKALPKLTGTFKRLAKGDGIVFVKSDEGLKPHEYFIPDHLTHDASNGDEVEIAVRKKSGRASDGLGEIQLIVKRATKQFVGTYFERDGESFVRVDGQIFTRSVAISDAGVSGAKPNNKVVLEMVRFPTTGERGEGVIVEVLGKAGDPKVDTSAIVRGLGIPDKFPEEVLAEAREQAAKFNENDDDNRKDYTQELVITIDPVDAKDFDDAVSLTRDPKTKHWLLTVHIADVGHFVPPGGALEREARLRGTSVYLPQRVIPMFPELISNGLASLQEGKVRYVKTAEMEFTAQGDYVGAHFANGRILNRKRFTYEQVQAILTDPTGDAAKGIAPEIVQMLQEMRTLSKILRAKRSKRGALELSMPEAVLEYSDSGHVSGAHFATNDDSHQLIESFMLAANEAVASHFDHMKIPFVRRIHPAPDPRKLEAFAEFIRTLHYKIPRAPGRADMQRLLAETIDKPDRHAVHYALLRSLKQARYTVEQDEHYALASEQYCHFTSPIRRYPDLVVHRLLGHWLSKKKVKADVKELSAIAEHCSKTERRAENAEREAVKLRILSYLSDRLGLQLDAVITGVAEYGFYALGREFPAEGLVHISTLTNDYYHHNEEGHSLEGKRNGQRYRLGDEVRVEVVRVDMQRRQLDLRVIGKKAKSEKQPHPPSPSPKRRGGANH
jgi:ribonuclease R